MSSVKAVISKFKRTQIWLTGGCSAFFEADFSVDFFSIIAGKMGKYEKEGKKYGSISLLMQSTCGSHQSHDVSSGSSPIFAGRVTRDQINPEKGCGFENYQEAKDLTLATSKALQCFSHHLSKQNNNNGEIHKPSICDKATRGSLIKCKPLLSFCDRNVMVLCNNNHTTRSIDVHWSFAQCKLGRWSMVIGNWSCSIYKLRSCVCRLLIRYIGLLL